MPSFRRNTSQFIPICLVILLMFGLLACNTKDDSMVGPGDDVQRDSGLPDTPYGDGGHSDSDAAPACDDGLQNGEETGVDCGGSECAACETGEACEASTDCASGFCTGGVCVDESCADMECAEDEACYRAVCYLACEDAEGCDPNSRCYQGSCLPLDCSSTECAQNETCYRGVCYGACSGDESCTEEGAECLEGSCVVPTCEDGLQNGDETDIDCGGSECGPCSAGKTCEIGEDCQPRVESPWSACDFGESICTEVGTRQRLVTSYVCGEAMTCEVVEEVETEACTRETDALECGDTVIGEWGQCQGAGEQGVCSTEGQRRRVITRFVCVEGGCDVIEDEEFEDCVLDTDDQACGAPETGDWSDCGGFDSVCDQTGERSRTVTYFECGSGDCTERVDVEIESCTRSTTGESCGEESFGAWSVCEGFTGVCGQTGTRSRTVTFRECSGGNCSTRTSTESEICTRNTNGDSCQPAAAGSWSSCSYADVTCSTSGTRTRTVTEYACQGGSCAQSSRTESDTSGCARTTAGTTCGSGTTRTGWSACSVANNGCSGTQTRTRTDRTCSGGSCQSTNTTESQNCNRANGRSCGAGTTEGPWSACSIVPYCEPSYRSRTVTRRTCSGGSCTSTTSTQSESCGITWPPPGIECQ